MKICKLHLKYANYIRQITVSTNYNICCGQFLQYDKVLWRIGAIEYDSESGYKIELYPILRFTLPRSFAHKQLFLPEEDGPPEIILEPISDAERDRLASAQHFVLSNRVDDMGYPQLLYLNSASSDLKDIDLTAV